MRDVIFTDKIPTPVLNQVLVRIDDTYSIKQRKSGVYMANSAHEEAEADSDGFKLSEFIIRHGVVEKLPRVIYKQYDWLPNDGEINKGDKVYWPIVNFFDYTMVQVINGNLFILVNYYDLHLKEVNGKPFPVNGYYLFKKETKKEVALAFECIKDTGWYIIEEVPERDIIYERDTFNYTPEWEVGDRCMLNVPPFQLEANTSEEFSGEYFLAQKRHILLAL